MSRIGRNDPCPCGSGMKYKRCCLGKDDVPPATDIRTVDGRVTERVFAWVLKAHEDRVVHVRPILRPEVWESEETLGLLEALVAYETPARHGMPLCLEAPPSLSRGLDPRELAWLENQKGAWFSIWDVLEVRLDEGFFLRDVFTQEERFVREARATRSVTERSLLLARIVRLDSVWTLTATHPNILAPKQAAFVEAEVRRTLELGRGKVDATRLRGEAAFYLAALWDEAVEAAKHAPRPRLQNTEGHPLVLTEDVYEFDADQRATLLEGLRALPRAEEEERKTDAPGLRFVFYSSEEDGLTLRASATLERDSLRVETNSTERADEMRALLEDRLGAHLRFAGRGEKDPWEMMVGASPGKRPEDAGPSSPALPPAEAASMILNFKAQHYATWPDTPLPALDGLTPRAAAADKRRKVYRELDIVLREMERHESREPFEQRYDIQALRRELGM